AAHPRGDAPRRDAPGGDGGSGVSTQAPPRPLPVPPVGRASADQRIPHPQEWPVYEDTALAEAVELLARGRSFDYDHGDELAGLETALRGHHRRRYALALASGTAALLAAYFALGIEPGDEVIVSDYTFF